jgi:AcrR family transcriptional regulator
MPVDVGTQFHPTDRATQDVPAGLDTVPIGDGDQLAGLVRGLERGAEPVLLAGRPAPERTAIDTARYGPGAQTEYDLPVVRATAGSRGSSVIGAESEATREPAASRISVTSWCVRSSIESFSTVVATSTTARPASMSGLVTRTPSTPMRTTSPTHGYERASLRDIAARAGVTHAALLRHFSGKDELLLPALARREEHEEELAARIIESGMSSPGVLSAVLREEFSDPGYQRSWMALAIAATHPDHPAHDFFTGRRERMRTRFHSGTLPTSRDSAYVTADEKVTLVLAMIDGLRIQALLDPSRKPLELLELLDIFMGLVVDPEGPPATPAQPKI